MKVFELRCPYCGGELEVKNNIDTFYCMHCGGKIMLEGFDDNTVKLKLKAQEVDLEKYKTDKKYEDLDKARQADAEESKRMDKIVVGIMIVCAVMMVVAMIFSKLGG